MSHVIGRAPVMGKSKSQFDLDHGLNT